MTTSLKPKPDWLKPLFPWEQHARTVNDRTMAYLDEGDKAARPVLLLSGNPTWGFLYRDFIKPLTDAGYRALVRDAVSVEGISDCRAHLPAPRPAPARSPRRLRQSCCY
jgi:hypothetical protein